MQLQNNVTESESVTRYIFSKRHFSKKNDIVKYGAYLPAEDGKASIFRTTDLDEQDIWEIGWEFVAKPTGRTLRARGDTSAAIIMDTVLDIVPDTTPHPRHANIVNWPPDKAEQKLLAVQIANQAKLSILPG